jgi:predicted N-acetyltransferase YhbS
MTVSLRAYQPSDLDALYPLWEATLGETWPLTAAYLKRMLIGVPRYQEGDYLVAEDNGQVVGFAATQVHSSGKEAGIALLMVKPDYQRQGIGTKLHTAAMERIGTKHVQVVNLAHSGADPFWPGVPLEPAGGIDFFKACGWKFPDINYDLTRDLRDYQTPPGVLKRVAEQGIQIRPTTADQAPAVVEFERRAFPFWAEFFEMTEDDGRYSDIVAAWDGERVVGSLLIEKPNLDALNPGGLWHRILGQDMGGLGAVGVDESYQGRGIGLAMVARGSEMLSERGVSQCVIGWTDLTDFYGKLGYRVWRSYGMTDQ